MQKNYKIVFKSNKQYQLDINELKDQIKKMNIEIAKYQDQIKKLKDLTHHQ